MVYYLALIPWSLGLNGSFKVGSLALDNANCVFLLMVQLLFPLITFIGNFESKTTTFSLAFDAFIYANLFALFSFSNVLLFFVGFEFLVILLFLLLLLFLQSYYWIRTSFFFFFYSLAGSLSFVLSIGGWVVFASSLFTALILMPILIKMPSFPFFYWLPEVHSESNSSISLLLAGLILKLSIYGLSRFILSTFYLSLQFLGLSLSVITLLGVAVIGCSCFRYFDLKKIIAFSSIMHLNLALVSCLSFNSCGLLSGMLISLSHSFSSIGLFLLAGMLINKTYSRYTDSLFMVDFVLRLLLVLLVLVNMNVPGSINFVGELLSLISVGAIDAFYVIGFLAISTLSCLLWFTILNRKLTCNYSYSLCLNPMLTLG